MSKTGAPSGSAASNWPDADAARLEDIRRLLSLLKQPWPEADSGQYANPSTLELNPWPRNRDPVPKYISDETQVMEAFAFKHEYERRFHQNTNLGKYYDEIIVALLQQRFTTKWWSEYTSPENVLRLLCALRVLLRDKHYHPTFHDHKGIVYLAAFFKRSVENYVTHEDALFSVDILREMTNIFQKLSAEYRDQLIEEEVHKSLVSLLSAHDVVVLHCSLYTLIGLAQMKASRIAISSLQNTAEMLLLILQEYDSMSKKLAASLLRLLMIDGCTKDMMKLYDGVPVLLSMLHSDNIKLLWHVVWCLAQLADDSEASNLIRSMGGIPLLLSLLQKDRNYIPERVTNSDMSITSYQLAQYEESEDVTLLNFSLKSACCAAISELVLNDTNAQQVVQNNGIHLLGLLILHEENLSQKYREQKENVQRAAFRALRFLFSMERNRRLFKKLFPPELYEAFIDVGHYVRDVQQYSKVVRRMNSMTKEELRVIEDNIESINQNKEPTAFFKEYAVLELLGSGAFGSVYKVRRQHGESTAFYAIKVINTLQAIPAKERDRSVGEIISELTIIKEQLRHPNIVRYYRTFLEADRLYIVMELIEGASLAEYFNSLKEKGSKFPEERVWNIFLQLVLGLRYLHKEKHIVHRDLSPNNIMLGENDKVTVTDFGLAKQKRKDCSKMTSVVGTILYSCPEIVQNQPYGEKADVWAIGCILYQLCTLKPPFYSNNMLSLATKIVEADYENISDGDYSEKIRSTVRLCLTPDPTKRPDIIGVARELTDLLLQRLDAVRFSQIATEKKLERERKRVRRQYAENTRNMANYHELFVANQERYDKLLDLAGSGNGSTLKEDLQEATSDSDMCIRRRAHRPSTSDTETDAGGDAGNADSRVGSAGSRGSPAHVSQTLLASPGHHRLSGNGEAARSVSPSADKPPRAPNRSVSTSDMVSYRLNSAKSKSRPSSGGTLTVSQRKVRQINDPILPMLDQLLKLVHISQLPPTLSHHPRRRIVERYKRALFSASIRPMELKEEMHRLYTSSREVIDLDFGGDSATVSLARQATSDVLLRGSTASAASAMSDFDPDPSDIGISYEQMYSFIEEVLEECGYYDQPLPSTPDARKSRFNPHYLSSCNNSSNSLRLKMNESGDQA